jgi:hypothetical protein
MPGEDPLTGVMPDIGIEQSARRATQGADFGDPRQRCHNRLDTQPLSRRRVLCARCWPHGANLTRRAEWFLNDGSLLWEKSRGSGDRGVTFTWKDYRVEGRERYKTITLATGEFIRRFLIHVLPKGLHRIRHYGLLANGSRAENVRRARELLVAPPPATNPEKPAEASEPSSLSHPCPCCGGRMLIIETFERGSAPRYRPTAPTAAIRIDTS